MSGLKVFLFANAGGSVTGLNGLASKLGPLCETVPMELPGRGMRADEPFFSDMEELITEMHREITEKRGDSPIALLGHSFGGAIIFEIARRMYELGEEMPEALFILGERPPFLGGRKRYTDLDEESFIKEIVGFGGISEVLLNNKYAMRYFAKIIRADMEIAENCESAPLSEPLPSDINVFGGESDVTVTREELSCWEDCTSGEFSLNMYSGSHFFIDENADSIAAVIHNTACRCMKKRQAILI